MDGEERRSEEQRRQEGPHRPAKLKFMAAIAIAAVAMKSAI